MKKDFGISVSCPICVSIKSNYKGRIGGIVGYNDIYECLDCNTKYIVMYMNEKPVHKMVINS